MYVIMVYDVNKMRVAKVLKVGRQYLTWIQNSVLEGEISWAQLEKLKRELKDVIEADEDSILLYVLRSEKWLERQRLGRSKGEPGWMI